MPCVLVVHRMMLLNKRRFSWREIAQPLIAFQKEVSLKAKAYLAERLFESTEVLYLRKEHIYKWKEQVQKNTQLTFWSKAQCSSYEICLRIHLYQ